MDQGSNKNHSPAYKFAPTVTKFCVMWEGQALPHDTKFGNCRCKIVDSRAFPSWSLIHGLRWSGLIKAEPGPCLTTAIWRYRNTFSQWQRSFQRKLRSHWLKFLWQHHVVVVKQVPGQLLDCPSNREVKLKIYVKKPVSNYKWHKLQTRETDTSWDVLYIDRKPLYLHDE